MRSARLLLTTAAASAVLALATPGAYAGDWDHDDSSSSYSKEHGKEHDTAKEEDTEHGKPHGGMHTGGGALTAVTGDDWATAKDPKYDPETYKEKDSSYKDSAKEKEDWSGSGEKDKGDWSGSGEKDKGDWSGSGEHDKPHGGMHTGGGALAGTTGVTAGGLAVLAVAATGAYTLRRKKTAAGLA
ncbi:hypothetical protein [Streptomyces griseus]|uniref:hypothetical protein n=1 Tax=Streptomyces griseus TaxID=1911 RepID=UPI00056A6CF6|nr:hypothetical protein [Streptomyces griseus]